MCHAYCSALILANSVRNINGFLASDSNVEWYGKLGGDNDWSGVLTWMQ